jgi:hypothetical protein
MPAARRSASALVLAFAALACGVARADAVATAPSAEWVAPERAPAHVRERCGLEAEIPRRLQALAPSVRLADGEAARRLVLRIEAVHAPAGGAWSGPKWIEVSGVLREGDRTAGSFRARRSSLGGPFAPFLDTCAILERCARAIASDVAAWIEDPTLDAQLGAPSLVP